MDNLPIGFVMALAENEAAMRRFAGLANDTRQQIIQQAQQANSREEMQEVVHSLV